MTDTELFSSWTKIPLKVCEQYSPTSFVRRNRTVAVLMCKGTHVHYAQDPAMSHVLIQRARTREFLKPLLETYGFLTTSNLRENVAAHNFVTRLGFSKTWSDRSVDHYMLCSLPFERAA
jgi:hypothetical protein